MAFLSLMRHRHLNLWFRLEREKREAH